MYLGVIDTSVLDNIVSVPGKCQQRDAIVNTLESYIANSVSLLLPLASIIETGNHIAQASNGHIRRSVAQEFTRIVTDAINHSAPWQIIPFPDMPMFAAWLGGFPESAMGEIGLADLSIIQHYNLLKKLHKTRRVFIWTLDHHLLAHSPAPPHF